MKTIKIKDRMDLFQELSIQDQVKILSRALWYVSKELESTTKETDAQTIYNFFKNAAMFDIEEKECRCLEAEVKEQKKKRLKDFWRREVKK